MYSKQLWMSAHSQASEHSSLERREAHLAPLPEELVGGDGSEMEDGESQFLYDDHAPLDVWYP